MTSSRHDHAAAPATRTGTLTPPSVRAGTSSLGLVTGTLLSGVVHWGVRTIKSAPWMPKIYLSAGIYPTAAGAAPSTTGER